ncbi:thioredoxin family protein (plasmid) [Cupriavidus sp. KK10]|jgi:thiol-disulfide isomerase/thioredoxin|uniref:thioredoxin family protein n=1 Tax=Cupriavidus sp. KK10 TaxID=1478019 RepID=UPI001BA6F465|nr:thioredoxin family protein [Cupriavidus sp. KK10]QUN31711.1 thioredoxin family protein [Cupriavidus sp. KK10]
MTILRALIAITLATSASLATAGEIKPYTPEAFDQLTHAGKPVVVDVSATWCPTCKAQKPIVEGLMKEPAYRDVTVLTVDFDSNKAALTKFCVGMQSTLVAFKGTSEVARSIGDTTPSGIEALIKKTAN